MIKVDSLSATIATIYIGGDIETAKRYLRRYCYDNGFCVTVEPTVFIYTGGEEFGIKIGILNYPKFPIEPKDLFDKVENIAKELITELCQRTSLVVYSGAIRSEVLWFHSEK